MLVTIIYYIPGLYFGGTGVTNIPASPLMLKLYMNAKLLSITVHQHARFVAIFVFLNYKKP